MTDIPEDVLDAVELALQFGRHVGMSVGGIKGGVGWSETYPCQCPMCLALARLREARRE